MPGHYGRNGRLTPMLAPTYCEVRGGSWASKPFELAAFAYREMDSSVRGVSFRLVRELAAGERNC